MPAPHHPPSNPPDQPPQWFLFGPWAFDITAAAAILRGEPRETVTLPVAPWARAYGLDRDPGTDTATIPLLGPGPGFDSRYAMTTDLTRPVIIATVHGSDPGERLALLIDGTHRLYKGHATGAAQLPAWVLTPAETLAIRAPRGSRAARRPGTGRSGR
jgi:hypothetical protein